MAKVKVLPWKKLESQLWTPADTKNSRAWLVGSVR